MNIQDHGKVPNRERMGYGTLLCCPERQQISCQFCSSVIGYASWLTLQHFDEASVEQELAPTMFPGNSGYPVPHFNMTSPGGGDILFGPTSWVNADQSAEGYTVLDDITKIVGRQTIKTGFLYRKDHDAFDGQYPFLLDGAFNSLNMDPTTGLGGGAGLAQFMIGAVGPVGLGGGVIKPSYDSFSTWGFYGQDEFGITSRFTLDLGLRYDLFGWFKTRYPYNANFCFTCQNPLTGLPGEVTYYPGNILPANKGDFGPRINFFLVSQRQPEDGDSRGI
jgi:hypothetical protein